MLTIIEHFFLLYRICIPVSVWWAYFISFNVANNNLLFSPWMPNSIVIVYVYLVLQSLRAQVQDIYKAARMAWTVRRPSLLVQISFERGGLIIASIMSIGSHKIWKESRSCRGDGIWQPLCNLLWWDERANSAWLQSSILRGMLVRVASPWTLKVSEFTLRWDCTRCHVLFEFMICNLQLPSLSSGNSGEQFIASNVCRRIDICDDNMLLVSIAYAGTA